MSVSFFFTENHNFVLDFSFLLIYNYTYDRFAVS